MNNVILPFLMSMLLGRTIDLTSYSMSGVNVFDDQYFDEIPVRSVQTTYNVVQEDAFPYTFFGLPADVVLRIKSGQLSALSGAMGLDGLLKDTSWKYNSAIVSTTTILRTVDRSLKEDASPLPEWDTRIPDSQTHFVRSLFYGGWYVVLFRFQCDVPSDVPAVRTLLTRHLGVVGSLTNDTIASWDRALNELKTDTDIRGAVRVTPHVYSTTPLPDFISSPESLMRAIEKLPEAVGALGQPLFMDLKPLHDLNDKFPVVKEDVAMLSQLEKMDEMLDDVKLAKTQLMKWMTDTLATFDQQQEEQISVMLQRLNDCIRAFSRVTGEASLFGSVDRVALEKAFHAYMDGLDKGIGTYNLALRRLKENIDAECEESFHEQRVRGLLRVYEEEEGLRRKVEGGLSECQRLCAKDPSCRSVGYADTLTELDPGTGLYYQRDRQCWIYYRSTATAHVHNPNGLSGDFAVYDRKCY